MPIALPTSGDGSVDAFLHLQTKRAGKVKGEATAMGQQDDIIVSGWHWGMQQSASLANTGKDVRSYQALTIHKNIDRSSTGLMAALATNDEVKEAKLCLRRSGSGQSVYYTVKLMLGRIASLSQEMGPDGTPRESLTIVFQKIDVEYAPQQSTGYRGGSTSFQDEILRG